MKPDAWLKTHAYLQPVARLHAQVESAAAGIEINGASVPCWDDYTNDFLAGVPLLQSIDAAIDLEPAGRMIGRLVEKLAADSLSDKLAAEMHGLDAELGRDAAASRHGAAWLLGDESFTPSSPGLLRYLGWTAMARYLRSVIVAFDGWRQEDRWLRNYCPTCGSPPAMAQLMGSDPGRLRFLCCGRCATRWQYKRTKCPFCEHDTERLSVVAVEGEARLRIDYCESCKGYIKTYNGQGEERIFLSDWTSLHLDVIANDRGLKRLAVSLFELEPAQQP